MDNLYLGLTKLRRGDVIRLFGTKYVVDLITACSARVVPLNTTAVIVEDKLHGKTVQFQKRGASERIAVRVELSTILERLGEEGLQNLLSSKTSRRGANNNEVTNESDSNMAKKDKKAAASNGEVHSKGKLGEIYGFSTTSVLRRLGMSGVSTAWARDIMKAKGVKVSDITVSIQVGNGRRGQGEPATITKAQVEELKALAPEPKEEPKAEKPAKKGKAAKAPKAKKAAKAAKTDAAPAPETAPAETATPAAA